MQKISRPETPHVITRRTKDLTSELRGQSVPTSEDVSLSVLTIGALRAQRAQTARRPGIPRPPRRLLASRVLDWSNVLRLHALTPLGRFVRHLGAFVEGLEALARYARVVHEEVLTPVVRGDEPVALLVTKPLNRSLGHILEPAFRVPGPPQTKRPPFYSGWRSFCLDPPYVTAA